MNKGNTVFMLFIGFLGVLLTYASWSISAKLNEKTCTSSNLKNSNQAVNLLGLSGIISCVSYFICVSRSVCDKDTEDKSSGLAIYGYLSFVLVIGIMIIVLGSIIEVESKKECKGVSKYSGIIWGTGVGLVLFSLSFFGFNGYKKYKLASLKMNSFPEMSSSF